MEKEQLRFHRILPENVWKWKMLEQKLDEVLSLHDYREIRLSVLQDRGEIHGGITALMQNGNAASAPEQTIDLCLPDGTQSKLSLRPEGTISILHHAALVHQKGDIHRFFYQGPMFRLDHAGKPEEFYQLGVELLGSNSLLTENEVISLGTRLLNELGLKDVTLKLNSFGCENCRRKYFEDMRRYLDEHADEFCRDCLQELQANPFADTGCHESRCRHHALEGPQIGDYICAKCKANLNAVKKTQANLNNRYQVDPRLYKNYAYYNETVFDFTLKHEGRETIIGGGGRYDHLSAKITRKRIPAVGFSLNLDEIFRIMDARSLFLRAEKHFAVYVCAQSPELDMMLLQVAQELHDNNIKTVLGADINSTETELENAKRHRCDLMIVLREDNIRDGKLLLRNITRDDQSYIPLSQIADSVNIARKAQNKF